MASAAAGMIDDRPEFANELAEAGDIADAARPLSWWERIWNHQAFRRIAILVGFAVLWEVGARASDNSLLFPSFLESVEALYNALTHGTLLGRIGTSIEVLLLGYSIAVALALVLT